MSLINNSSYAQKVPTIVSLSAAELSWLQLHPDVLLGVGLHWAPFDFIDSGGQHSGITSDYLKLIAQKTGLNFQLSIDQWSNNLDKIRDQKIDLLGAANYTEERSHFAHFSKPYFDVIDYFFIRDDLAVKTLNDLNGKRVAVPDQYAQADVLKKHFPKIEIISVANFSGAVDAVLENRADALFDTYAAITYALKKEGISTIIPFKSSRHLSTNPIRIMSRKGAPELASIIQKGLDAITDKERNSIYQRWIGKAGTTRNNTVTLSASEKAWIKTHPIVSVGGSPDWGPFNFTNENNEYSGIAHDYLQLIADKTGLTLDIHIAPWNINLQKTKDKKIDLLGAVYFTEERSTDLNFSKPYFEVLDFFFIRDDIEAKTLQDLNGKRVAVPKDYAHIQFLQQHFPTIEIVLVNSFSEAINSVLEHKAELLYDTYGSLTYTFSKKGINTIIPFKSTSHLGSKYIHIASRKGAPELTSIIQKGLDSISEDEKRTISRRWLGKRPNAKPNTGQLTLSETERLWLSLHPVIRFTGDPNWLPYEAFDEQGNYIGIVADHLQIIEEMLGIEVDIIQTQSWGESIEKTKQGKIDVLSETADSALKTHLTFTEPHLSSPVVLIMNKNAGYIEGLAEAQHLNISAIKDYGYLAEIIKTYPDQRFSFVNTIQEGLTDVSTGKTEVLIATLAQASYWIAEMGISNIQIAGKTKFNTKLAFGMQKEFSPLIPLFNRALRAIPKSEKQRIMNKWLNNNVNSAEANPAINSPQNNWQIWPLIAAAVIFLLLVGLFIFAKRIPDEVLVRRFGSGRSQIFALLITTLFIILIGITINYMLLQNRDKAVAQTHHNLSITLQGVVQQMDRWVNDRLDLLHQLGEHPRLLSITKSLLTISTEPKQLKASSELAQARRFFANKEKVFGLSSFFIINPEMINIGSARDANIGQINLIAKQRPELLNKAFAGEAVFIPLIISDLDRSDSLSSASCGQQCMSMFFAAPVRNASNQVIAVLTQRILPDEDFSQVLRFGRIGDSGESYVIGEDGLLASQSRFRDQLQQAGLLLSEQNEVGTIEVRDPGGNILEGFQASPSTKNPFTKIAGELIRLSGKKTSGHHSKLHTEMAAYNDYRGVPVFGVGLWDYHSGIGIVTEINVDEALAGYYQLRLNLLLLSTVLLLLFASTVLFTLTLTSRAGQAMRRTHDDLEQRVNERTNELKHSEKRLRKANEQEVNAHKSLKESQDLFTSMASNIPGVIYRCLLDENWTVLYISDAFYELSGYPASEYINQNMRKFTETMHPDDIDRVTGYLHRQVANNQKIITDYRLIKPSGELKWVRLYGQVIYSDEGDVGWLDGAVFDISDVKQAQEKAAEAIKGAEQAYQTLAESKDLFTSMVSNVPGVIYRCRSDERLTMLYISDGIESLTGHPPSDYLNETLSIVDKFHPDDVEYVTHYVQEKLTSNENYSVDFRLLNLTGEVKWARSQGQAVYGDDGNISWIDGAIFDINDVKKAEQLAAKATERAELANKSKSDFLANMSHEIRTPMNAILGFTGLLSEQVQDPRHQSFIKTIQSAGNNLMVLINDILDLSRIEAGKFEINKVSCNPTKLLHEITDIFRLKVAEKNLDLILDIDPLIPQSLLLDQVRLRQVLLNLIGNAIKFTEKGFIRIQLQAENKDDILSKVDLLISVEDSGIGVSKEQQHLIFKEFTQSSGQDTRKYGGTGLGLSIGKRLVEMMGGTISLSSEPGKGSTFNIRLLSVDVATLQVPLFAEKTPTAQQKVMVFSPATLLIVDDVEDNRELLIANFANTALKTTIAKNGLEAVNLVKQKPVDLILMDIRMPTMNGYQAADEIKKFSNVPIIALTASVMTGDFKPIHSADFDGYLRKPVLKADLFQALSQFLPFNLIDNTQEPAEKSLTLSDIESEVLPLVLEKLETLSSSYQEIFETNNLADIKQFAEALIEINKLHPLKLVEDFAQQLLDQVASFDISAIKRSMNYYPKLIAQLNQKDKKTTTETLAS